MWSPSGHLLAVASHDNKVITWGLLTLLSSITTPGTAVLQPILDPGMFEVLCSTLYVRAQVHQLDHSPSLHEGDPVTYRALIYQVSCYSL